jgi:hypothetical protein
VAILEVEYVRSMRAVRFAIVALIAMALAVLPVTASIAKVGAAQAGMSMGAPDDNCPCCDTSNDRAADTCHLKCCHAAAVLVEAQPLTPPTPGAGTAIAEGALSPFSQPPDPPPPRG